MVIATRGPFELFARLRSVPLDPLVDALRALHEGRGDDAGQLQALLSPRPAASSAAAPPSSSPAIPHSADYDQARHHFVEHARRLREQAILAEKLLERIVRPESSVPAPPLQRELTVVCPRGGCAATRFLLVNGVDRDVDVEFRVGQLHGVTRESLLDVVSFDPPAPRLRKGEEIAIALAVDLRRWSAADDRLDAGIDVLADARTLMKLWLRVNVQ